MIAKAVREKRKKGFGERDLKGLMETNSRQRWYSDVLVWELKETN